MRVLFALLVTAFVWAVSIGATVLTVFLVLKGLEWFGVIPRLVP